MASRQRSLLTCFALAAFTILRIQTQSITGASPVTSTFIGSAIPTPVASYSEYHLLGCYVEPPASSEHRALGPPGTYIMPPGLDNNTLTVDGCLSACATVLSSTGAAACSYAGLENADECYCSPEFLVNSTHMVASGFCTSPCSGDATTSCGGYGYIDVYQWKPNPASASSIGGPATSGLTISLLPTSSTWPIATASHSFSSPSPGAIAGLVLGSLGAVAILLLLYYCHQHRHKRQQTPAAQISSLFDLSTPITARSAFQTPGVQSIDDPYSYEPASPRLWDPRGPTLPSKPRYTPAQRTPIHSLEIIRNASPRRHIFERWGGGEPLELEGSGAVGNRGVVAGASSVGAYTSHRSSPLTNGIASTDHERQTSWRVGDEEVLSRINGSGAQRTGNAVLVVSDPAEMGYDEVPRARLLVESPVLGLESVRISAGAATVEDEEGEEHIVSALTQTTGGWSVADVAAEAEKEE